MGVQFAGNILVQSNGGPLPISLGGTGQTSASAAITALLPLQSGQSGKALVSNGTVAAWQNLSGTPGGSDTAIQYNDAGSFGGNTFLTINKSTGAVTSTSTLTNQGILISKAAATLRQIDFQTSGSDRWFLQANTTAESGSNAGSNFELVRIADNGTTQNVVYTVSRATGVMDFAVAPTVAGSPISGASVAGSNTQIQYNNSGAFGASAQFSWDDSARVFTLGSTVTANGTTITGRTGAGAAADLTISGGTGAGTQSGGALTIQAGVSTTELSGGANPGPNLVLKGGTGGGNSPTGGVIILSTSPDYIANQTERLRINYNGAFGLSGANFGTSGQVLTSQGSGSAPIWSTAAAGTVTSVSVTTANGVSGSVATATTTPAITLTLGAITPSSVASTGAVSGTSLSSSGNISTTSASARITGDFSTSATVLSRTFFQSSTTNGNTIISAMPNGTGTTSAIALGNTTALNTNGSAFTQYGINGSVTSIVSSNIGATGTALPLAFTVNPDANATPNLQINANGNWSLAGTAGTNGQVLTANTGAAPTWQTFSASALSNTTTLGTVTNSAVSITGISGTTSASSPMSITAGATSTGTGNSLTLSGGSPAAGSVSGAVTIQTVANGTGGTGAISITTATTTGNGATAGSVSITGGDATNTTAGTGGSVSLTAGSGFTASGQITIQAGPNLNVSGNTTAGRVTIQGGTTTSTVGGATGVGGSILINGGLGSASVAGGSIVFQTAANGSFTERMRITAAGAFTMAGTTGTNGQVLTSNGSGVPSWAAPATSGTVTSVSVTTANGVSGSVATSTTTPAITLTLGAITPSSVASTGAVSGSSLSSTSDLTFTGTGSRIILNNPATLPNRTMIVSGTSNSFSSLGIVPNGTGNQSEFVTTWGNAAGTGNTNNLTTNFSYGGILMDGTGGAAAVLNLYSARSGTGVAMPIIFSTGTTGVTGSERMRIDNVGAVTFAGGSTGTNGQVLTSNGSGVPSWATPSVSTLGNSTTLGTTTNTALSITGLAGTTSASSPMTITASSTTTGTGNSLTISAGATSNSGSAGGALVLKSGDGTNNTAGAVTIHADGTSNSGGAVTVRGGNGAAGSGAAGGNLTLQAGDASATSGLGGSATLRAGASAGGSASGTVTITGGNNGGAIAGGAVTISGGTVTSAQSNTNGGAVTINGGTVQAGATGTSTGGDIIFQTATLNTLAERMRVTAAGAVQFPSSGRITGDFSNGTVLSRTIFQTSTSNGNTNLTAMPNGTGNGSAIALGNTTALGTNGSQFVQLAVSSTTSSILSGTIGGTGTALPFTITVGATTNMTVSTAGNVSIGTASLATNATNGFPYIPTCAGTPTGAPTAITGYAPMVIDSTNNKLYFFAGGSWRLVTST